MTPGIVSNVYDGKLDTVNLALVQYNAAMSSAQAKKFKEYLEARLQIKDINIVLNTSLPSKKR